MEEWKLVALSAALSLLSSVIVALLTGVITARITRDNDDRRAVNEKRILLYYKIQIRIESLIYNSEQIYTLKYRNSVLKYRPHVALWASENVRNVYNEFYDYVNRIFAEYIDYCQEPYPDEMIDEYKKEHLPDIDKLKGFRNKLYKVMQKDMGIKNQR